MNIENLQYKRTLVLGLGQEGFDNLSYLNKNYPQKKVGVADQKTFEELGKEVKNFINQHKEKLDLFLGSDYLSSLNNDYEVIIKTPGIPFHQIKPLVGSKQILTSQTDLFLNSCPGTIIGVTGTKGKSTTATLLGQIFDRAGFNVFVVGNIENPALSYIDEAREDDIYIYELSSFQLMTVNTSPEVGVLLNIYKDHLDQHSSFEEYVEAKRNITRYQNEDDYLVFNTNNALVKEIASSTKAQKIPFTSQRPKKPFIPFVQPLFKVANLYSISKDVVQGAIDNFQGLPHRLEYVGEVKGIKFYDDSASTIPEAVIYGIDSLGSQLSTLIVGGVDKGGDYEKMVAKIEQSDIKNLILFPDSGHKINALVKDNKLKTWLVDSMDKAVEIAFEETDKGKVCLLSPASSSFNMFRNYKHRGNVYKKLVKNYLKENGKS